MPAHRPPGTARAALLTAGFTCIADVGWTRATTAQICRRAGVSSGTFFHHFPTKEDLLLALLVEPEHEQAPDDLRSLLEQMLKDLADPRMPAFVREVATLTRVPRVRDALARQEKRELERIRLALAAARDTGLLEPGVSVEQAALRIRLVIIGAQSLMAEQQTPVPELREQVEAAVRDLATLALRSIDAPVS